MTEAKSKLFAGNQEEDEEHAVTTPLEEGLRALQQRGCTSLTGPPKSTKLGVDRQNEEDDEVTGAGLLKRTVPLPRSTEMFTTNRRWLAVRCRH